MKFLQKAKKSLGQNFLIDKNIINKIIKIPNVDKNKLYLCKNEQEMEILLKSLPIRDDYKNITLRKNLLNQFNTPYDYASKLSNIIKEGIL